jgi:hypothetical protein
MDAPLVEGEDSNLYDVCVQVNKSRQRLIHESLRTEIERSLEIDSRGLM